MNNVTPSPTRSWTSLRWRMPLLLAAVALASPPMAIQAVTLVSTLGQAFSSGAVSIEAVDDYWATDFLTGPDAALATTYTLHLRNRHFLPHTVIAEIWSDNAGRPGSLLDTFDVPITVPAEIFPFASYTGSDPGIPLAANTVYWLAIRLGEADPDLQILPVQMELAFNQAVDAGSLYSGVPFTYLTDSQDGGANWSDSGPVFGDNAPFYELAGDVVSSVPDAGSTLPLLGLAFAGLAWFHRRATTAREPAGISAEAPRTAKRTRSGWNRAWSVMLP